MSFFGICFLLYFFKLSAGHGFFYEEMRSRKVTPKLKQVIDENNFIVGFARDSSTSEVKPSTVKEATSAAISKGVKSVKLFQRLMHNGLLIHSRAYARPSKQNTYTILYVEDGEQQFGQIECYFSFNAKCKYGCVHNLVLVVNTPLSYRTWLQLVVFYHMLP